MLFDVSELSVAGSIRSGDHLASISERLVGIMKNYVSAERYFPLGVYCLFAVFTIRPTASVA